jgi:hypothetical protein
VDWFQGKADGSLCSKTKASQVVQKFLDWPWRSSRCRVVATVFGRRSCIIIVSDIDRHMP